MKKILFAAFCLTLLLAGCGLEKSAGINNDSSSSLTVYLVRHAEKVDSSRDSDLTPKGMTRATDLATALKSANIDMIHSTDFNRTLKTAKPTSDYYNIPISKYDHKNLQSLADNLLANGGNHLVVGHSNSTPSMVKLLGGDPGPEIDEKKEFDRIYIITRDKLDKMNSVMIKYGNN